MRGFMKLKSALIALLCMITTTLVHADPGSELTTLLNNVQSMKANFTQTIYDNKNKAVQKSYGVMSMQRPGKFRWDVKKPIPQLIIANQSKLWIYDADLMQVTIRSLKKAAGETPALLLSDVNGSLQKDFTVTPIAAKTPNSKWFNLVPKKADNSFSAVKLVFVNNEIVQMDLTDQMGHTTKIEYKNIQTNVPLAANLFTFKPGANVDVIDETRKKG